MFNLKLLLSEQNQAMYSYPINFSKRNMNSCIKEYKIIFKKCVTCHALVVPKIT